MNDDLTEWKILFDKGFIDEEELYAHPFNATVVKRLKADPEYKEEVIKEIIKLIQIEELETAKVLLEAIIEAANERN
jgi:hypothetical protein